MFHVEHYYFISREIFIYTSIYVSRGTLFTLFPKKYLFILLSMFHVKHCLLYFLGNIYLYFYLCFTWNIAPYSSGNIYLYFYLCFTWNITYFTSQEIFIYTSTYVSRGTLLLYFPGNIYLYFYLCFTWNIIILFLRKYLFILLPMFHVEHYYFISREIFIYTSIYVSRET